MRDVLVLKLAYRAHELVVGGLALVVRRPAGAELTLAGGYRALRAAAVKLALAYLVGDELLIVAEHVLAVFFLCRLVLTVLFVIGGLLLVIGGLLLLVIGLAVTESLLVVSERVELRFERGVVCAQTVYAAFVVGDAGQPRHERGQQQYDGEDDGYRPPLSFVCHVITF